MTVRLVSGSFGWVADCQTPSDRVMQAPESACQAI
jgi:hypothetical protein